MSNIKELAKQCGYKFAWHQTYPLEYWPEIEAAEKALYEAIDAQEAKIAELEKEVVRLRKYLML